MKMCMVHWTLMRASIEEHGLDGLVAKSGEAALEALVDDVKQVPDPKNERFDPLMSMNWHFMNGALERGGLYLLGVDEKGEQYCPLCEYEKHAPGFVAKTQIDSVASQIQAWCREQGLIPKVA